MALSSDLSIAGLAFSGRAKKSVGAWDSAAIAFFASGIAARSLPRKRSTLSRDGRPTTDPLKLGGGEVLLLH